MMPTFVQIAGSNLPPYSPGSPSTSSVYSGKTKYRQVRRNPGASNYCTQLSSGVKYSRDPFMTMCVTTVSTMPMRELIPSTT